MRARAARAAPCCVQMRYLVQDKWPPGYPPIEIPTEEHILNAAMEDIVRCAAPPCPPAGPALMHSLTTNWIPIGIAMPS